MPAARGRAHHQDRAAAAAGCSWPARRSGLPWRATAAAAPASRAGGSTRKPRSPSTHRTEEPLSLCSHQDPSWWRKLPALRETPRSMAGSTAEHAAARPKVNGSPPGRTRHVCDSYMTISSTGPARLPDATLGSPGRCVNRPARGPPGQQRRIRRAPAWPVIRHGGLPGGVIPGRLAPVVPGGAVQQPPLAGRSAWRPWRTRWARRGRRGRAARRGSQAPARSAPRPPARACCGRPARGAAGPAGSPAGRQCRVHGAPGRKGAA